jgi:hypothetical protein
MTGEEEILALLGKMVAHWNYAEHCSRQIVRKRIPGGDIDDEDHIGVSKKPAKWVEDQLRDEVLPRWTGAPGETHLRHLIDAFSAAREYRNYYVHGVWMTAATTPAQAIIIPAKPHNNMTQAPGFATAADMRPTAIHLEELGAFACEVGNAFDNAGQRAKNPSGSLVVTTLPPLIKALTPFPYAPLVTW